MSNSTESESSSNNNQDHLTSPVTVLPLILIVIAFVAVTIFGLVAYRRKKRVKLLNQLRLTEKRIQVVSAYLENVDDETTTRSDNSTNSSTSKDEGPAAEDNKTTAINIPTDFIPAPDTAKTPPPHTHPVPAANRKPFPPSAPSVTFTGPKPIYISSSELSLTEVKGDDPHCLQTSLEVQCSTPTVPGGRTRRRFVRPHHAMIEYRNKTYTIARAPAMSLEEYCRIKVRDTQVISRGRSTTASVQCHHDMCSNMSEITPFEVTSTSIRNNCGSEFEDEDVRSQCTSIPPDGNCSIYQTAIELEITDNGSEIWV